VNSVGTLTGYICDFWSVLATDILFFLVSLSGVRLSPLGMSATAGLLYQPRMIDDDYGAVSGMRIGRGHRSTRRKPAPVPLCPPQIPHALTWDLTWAAAVGSRRLTAWAMAQPHRRTYLFLSSAILLRILVDALPSVIYLSSPSLHFQFFIHYIFQLSQSGPLPLFLYLLTFINFLSHPCLIHSNHMLQSLQHKKGTR
jgi:hypothetical protein